MIGTMRSTSRVGRNCMDSCLHCWHPDAATHAWVFLWPRSSGFTFPISRGWHPIHFIPQHSALSCFAFSYSAEPCLTHERQLTHWVTAAESPCSLRVNNRQPFLTLKRSLHMCRASPIKLAPGCNTQHSPSVSPTTCNPHSDRCCVLWGENRNLEIDPRKTNSILVRSDFKNKIAPFTSKLPKIEHPRVESQKKKT